MKQPARLTREHKDFLTKRGYNPSGYAFMNETKETFIFWDKKKKEPLNLEKRRYKKELP